LSLAVLVGRQAELDRVEALLDRARDGLGGALIIRGEPGIGKTALLDAARARAGGMQVTQASGVESEAGLPFAALGELAAPMLDHLAALPEPQAAALAAALALAPADGAANERLAIFAGFLGLIGATAHDRPLLIMLDDAHWLDRSSAECLGYAARRLGERRVALVIAARPQGEAETLGGGAVEELSLRGLGRSDALLLLASAQLAAPVADIVLELSLGNPLSLLELPPMLSEAQRRGVAPIDSPPAPGGALGEALERRLAAAGPEAAELMLVASASFDRALGPVVAAARDLGVPDAALERCEEAGLLEIDGNAFRLAHPLLRGVAYEAAAPADRRRAHRALAGQTTPDSAAWHLAAAAVGPDEGIARALDGAAQRAGARGAHEASADALERAAQLTSPGPDRWRRLFAAGISAALGGAYERAASLLESSADTDDPSMRVRSKHMLAMVTLNGGIRGAHESFTLLTTEAERIAPSDPAVAALLYADAGVTATVAGVCDLVLGSAEKAVGWLPEDAPSSIRAQVESIHGMGLALKGRISEAAEALDRAGALLGTIDPVSPAAQSTSFALMGRFSTGDVARLRAETHAFAEAARESRSIGVLPWFQLQAADAAYRLGAWDDAEREANEAVANAEVSSQLGPLSVALIIRGRIHAARGREAAARVDANRGVEIADPVGYGSPRLWSMACLGFLELGLGRAEEAIEELEQAHVLADISGLDDPLIVPWAPELIEAYARAGRDGEAVELAAVLGEQAERSGAPLALALAARCRGLVAEAGFEPEFERALELHLAAGSPFERGRTLLAYGTRLHRARRRVDARKRLREALAAFEQLRARPWSAQARDQLRAAGAVERSRFDDPDALTGQEVRVAEAVARGLTNREVAAELFLSPKTIDFHLGRVYRKLDIHSRAELATLVAEGRLEQPGAARAR
jgi:DNA-binding CsgD family transcriptional regulator